VTLACGWVFGPLGAAFSREVLSNAMREIIRERCLVPKALDTAARLEGAMLEGN
jgi:hypothetical protein